MLFLNGRRYTCDELINIQLDGRPWVSPYERHTLRFCQQWLRGQERFSLKTSGSTGKPSTVILKRLQMVASARLTGQWLGLQPGDSALVGLSTQYIAGLMMLVRGFELGLSLTVVTPSRNPLMGLSNKTKFTFTSMVPMQLQEVLTKTPEKISLLNTMRAILLGGAPVNRSLLKKIRILDCPVYHTYGMTETVSHIAFRRLNDHCSSDYFVPLEGVELALNDYGCLMIKAPVTDNKVLLTNDCVELRDDGSFRWIGRTDNVINTGGFKVQAEKVEMTLEKVFQKQLYYSLANRRFFVGPFDDLGYGQVIAAIVEGAPFSEAFQSSIKGSLQDSGLLMPYEIPKVFRFLPRFLETSTGKIDRLANLARLSDN